MKTLVLIGLALTLTVAATGATGADLARRGDRTGLVADRVAGRIGDSLTVLVYENASASNSAQAGSRRERRLSGEATTSTSDPQTARLALEGRYDGGGQSGRADRMVAQISVLVTEVLPGGDLLVAGDQRMMVNGHDTRISVAGRVRPADISSANTVLSSRVAEARIAYDGHGFSSRAARPGFLDDLLSKLWIF